MLQRAQLLLQLRYDAMAVVPHVAGAGPSVRLRHRHGAPGARIDGLHHGRLEAAMGQMARGQEGGP